MNLYGTTEEPRRREVTQSQKKARIGNMGIDKQLRREVPGGTRQTMDEAPWGYMALCKGKPIIGLW